MPEKIAAFPLGLIAFPGEEVNLHIFEPRYQQLVKDCEAGITFAIVPIIKGTKVTHATEMELIEVSKLYEDGKSDIRTRALNLLRVDDMFSTLDDKPYPGAEVERLYWDDEPDIVICQSLLPLLKELYQLLDIENVTVASEDEFRSYQVAHKIGFTQQQELEFLKIIKEADRQAYMLTHIELFLPKVKEMINLKTKAALNGHFKHIRPENF